MNFAKFFGTLFLQNTSGGLHLNLGGYESIQLSLLISYSNLLFQNIFYGYILLRIPWDTQISMEKWSYPENINIARVIKKSNFIQSQK